MNLWSGLVDRSVPERFISTMTADDFRPKTRRDKLNKARQAKCAAIAEKKRAERKALIDGLIESVNSEPDREAIAKALEAKRLKLGLRSAEFAAVLGISRSFYSDVKAGRRALYLAATRRAYALGVDAGVLLGND